MDYKETLEEYVRLAHSDYDINFFSETNYSSQNTNCYAAAIGLANSGFDIVKAPGCISNKKAATSRYTSISQLKTLLEDDLYVLGLNPREIVCHNRYSLVRFIQSYNLKDNEYIIILFSKIYPANGEIADFHFIRFDNQNGWIEKQGRWPLRRLNDINGYDWPSGYEAVASYVLTR